MQKFAASNEVLYCAHTCNCWRRLDDDSIEWCLSVSHNPSSLASNHHSCARCFCVHVLVQMVVLAWLMAFKLGLQGVPQASRGLQWLYLYTGGAQEEHVTVTTDKIDLSTQRQEQERRQQQGQGQLEPSPSPSPTLSQMHLVHGPHHGCCSRWLCSCSRSPHHHLLRTRVLPPLYRALARHAAALSHLQDPTAATTSAHLIQLMRSTSGHTCI